MTHTVVKTERPKTMGVHFWGQSVYFRDARGNERELYRFRCPHQALRCQQWFKNTQQDLDNPGKVARLCGQWVVRWQMKHRCKQNVQCTRLEESRIIEYVRRKYGAVHTV